MAVNFTVKIGYKKINYNNERHYLTPVLIFSFQVTSRLSLDRFCHFLTTEEIVLQKTVYEF